MPSTSNSSVYADRSARSSASVYLAVRVLPISTTSGGGVGGQGRGQLVLDAAPLLQLDLDGHVGVLLREPGVDSVDHRLRLAGIHEPHSEVAGRVGGRRGHGVRGRVRTAGTAGEGQGRRCERHDAGVELHRIPFFFGRQDDSSGSWANSGRDPHNPVRVAPAPAEGDPCRMWLQSRRRDVSVPPERALPGRPDYDYPLAHVHEVLGTSMLGPFPAGVVTLYLGMGCFWGAEKRLWQLPGVHTTAAGYQGGPTPHPTYSEVCSGRTGHAEMVLVAYDPTVVATIDVLRVFWENHDPTQGMRQGNDVGSQYRSAVFWSTHEQQALVESSAAAYDEVLRSEGFDPITTELGPALQDGEVVLPFYYAEPHHQQYLHKNPHGYDCHAHTGILLPDIG